MNYHQIYARKAECEVKKMTLERAMEILNPKHREHYDSIETVNETYRIGMQAIEKQIPKKVTHEATLYRCCTCPTCKNVVDEFTKFMGNRCRVTPTHCKYCGQALDWGIKNENN